MLLKSTGSCDLRMSTTTIKNYTFAHFGIFTAKKENEKGMKKPPSLQVYLEKFGLHKSFFYSKFNMSKIATKKTF
jgi:hypothetical protein